MPARKGITAAAFAASLSTAGRTPAAAPAPVGTPVTAIVERWNGARFVSVELVWNGTQYAEVK